LKCKLDNDILKFSTQKLGNIWIKAALAMSFWLTWGYALRLLIRTGSHHFCLSLRHALVMRWGNGKSLLAVTELERGKSSSLGSGIWVLGKWDPILLLAT